MATRDYPGGGGRFGGVSALLLGFIVVFVIVSAYSFLFVQVLVLIMTTDLVIC
jgi:hypothetical protein